MANPNREDAHLPAAGWSPWVRAMVPEAHRSAEERDGEGYFYTNIRNAFNGYNCGIYEFQLRKADVANKVVYVGSTCRGNEGALTDRILEYCRNGSHKAILINEALKKGFEIYIRVNGTCSRDEAEVEENELLDNYNYAWNKRRNGRTRNVLD